MILGKPSLLMSLAAGGYWSNHVEQFGYVDDCGDPLPAAPSSARDPRCGMAFLACE